VSGKNLIRKFKRLLGLACKNELKIGRIKLLWQKPTIKHILLPFYKPLGGIWGRQGKEKHKIGKI